MLALRPAIRAGCAILLLDVVAFSTRIIVMVDLSVCLQLGMERRNLGHCLYLLRFEALGCAFIGTQVL